MLLSYKKTKSILFTFLLILNLNAQQNSNFDAESKAYFTKIPEFENTTVPEKWKNESAVTIARYDIYEYSAIYDKVFKFQSNKVLTIKKRDRVLLNDQKGLETYAEQFFPSGCTDKFIRIIKKNGNVLSIENKDFIPVLINTKKKTIEKNIDYYKVAVPNLEIGDIIDIFYSYQVKLEENQYFTGYQYFFNNDIPTCYEKLSVSVNSDNFKIIYRNYNNAPALMAASDYSDNNMKFEIVTKNMEKFPKENYSSKYKTLPYIYFQINEKLLIETLKLSMLYSDIKQELINKADIKIVHKSIKKNIDYYLKIKNVYPTTPKNLTEFKFLNSLKKIENDKKIEHYYYYLRSKQHKYKGSAEARARYYGLDYETHIKKWKSFAKKHKLSFEYGVALDPQFKDLSEIQGIEDLTIFPIVNGVNIFNFSDHENYDFKKYENINSLIYTFNNSKNADVFFIQNKALINSAKENIVNSMQNIKINLDSNQLLINNILSINGVKKEKLNNELFKFYSFHDKDFKRSKVKLNKDSNPKLVELKMNGYVNLENEEINPFALRINQKKNRLEEIKADSVEFVNYIKKFISIGELNITDFKVENDGRFMDNPNLIFNVRYNKNDLITKIGKEYLFSIGKLLDFPYDYEDFNNRKNDFIVTALNTNEYNFKIEIPSGLNVYGLEKLNFQFYNNKFEFDSKAFKEGNFIIFKCNMIMKTNLISKDETKEYLDIFKQIFDLTQTKILFK